MKKKIYNKLIRDKIPEIIRADKAEPSVRKLEKEEYKQALRKKVVEEAKELLEEAKTKEEVLEEAADVYEVIRSLAKAYGVSVEEIIEQANTKKDKRGGFDKKLFLENIVENT